MREQLIQYVELLFAGAPNSTEIKQEILQNTLDRYDDLIAQGKQPEAAYRLAISGIGDINEILGSTPSVKTESEIRTFDPGKRIKPEYRYAPTLKKVLRAAAIFLYIISIIPLIVLSELGMEIIGLCGTIGIVAVATALIIIAGDKEKVEKKPESPVTPKQELRSAVKKIINTTALVLYLILSFGTGSWHNTWLVFPIAAAVWGLVKACMDLKEASVHEN